MFMFQLGQQRKTVTSVPGDSANIYCTDVNDAAKASRDFIQSVSYQYSILLQNPIVLLIKKITS